MVMAAIGARVRRGVRGERRGLGVDEAVDEERGACVVTGVLCMVEGADVVEEERFVTGWVDGFGGEGPEEDITVVEGREDMRSLKCRGSGSLIS
jgi:hypothetical protein